MVVDFYFFYKFVVRFLLVHKCTSIVNTYSIPAIKSLQCFFPIRSVEDKDLAYSYNYGYLFRYFFGRKSFLVEYKTTFSLNKYYNNFDIKSLFYKRHIFYMLYFFLYAIKPIVAKHLIKQRIVSKKPFYYLISIHDLNVFAEKKTNLGLYSLMHVFEWRFFCSGNDLVCVELMKCLKLINVSC